VYGCAVASTGYDDDFEHLDMDRTYTCTLDEITTKTVVIVNRSMLVVLQIL